MSTYVGIPPFSNPLWVAMETMHFHIAHTNFLRTPLFRILGVPMNNLAPMKNCPVVQGNLNWMPGHIAFVYLPELIRKEGFSTILLILYTKSPLKTFHVNKPMQNSSNF